MSEHREKHGEIIITGTAVKCPFGLCIYNHAKGRKLSEGYCTKRQIHLVPVSSNFFETDYLDCADYTEGAGTWPRI